jgi:small subunit ribosomal protein S9
MEKTKTKKYTETVGRRKTSSARVRVLEASKSSFIVNEKDAHDYFPTSELKNIIHGPVAELGREGKFEITVKVKGGGVHSQAEAVRHGVSRALVEMNEEDRTTLKKAGFLKRDPRIKERRKFGLKKARKSPQWSKR